MVQKQRITLALCLALTLSARAGKPQRALLPFPRVDGRAPTRNRRCAESTAVYEMGGVVGDPWGRTEMLGRSGSLLPRKHTPERGRREAGALGGERYCGSAGMGCYSDTRWTGTGDHRTCAVQSGDEQVARGSGSVVVAVGREGAHSSVVVGEVGGSARGQGYGSLVVPMVLGLRRQVLASQRVAYSVVTDWGTRIGGEPSAHAQAAGRTRS